MKSDLPIIFITDVRAAAAAIALLKRRKAWAVVYVEDISPGVCTVQTAIAEGHEHREHELEAFVRREAECAGFSIPISGAA